MPMVSRGTGSRRRPVPGYTHTPNALCKKCPCWLLSDAEGWVDEVDGCGGSGDGGV